MNGLMKKNKKVSLDQKPFFVMSRRAVAGWTCVAFILCAWMFFIGVLVGRGTAPLKFNIATIQKELEAAREKLMNNEQLQADWKSRAPKDKTMLDFYEALKDNRGDRQLNTLKNPASDNKAPVKTPVEKTESAAEKSDASNENSSEKVPSEDRPESPAGKQRTDSDSKSNPAGVTYTIQAASMKDRQDADRLVASLKKQGFQAHRAIGKVPGKGIWYRVRIGEFKTKADTHHTVDRLKRAGMKPIIVEK